MHQCLVYSANAIYFILHCTDALGYLSDGLATRLVF